MKKKIAILSYFVCLSAWAAPMSDSDFLVLLQRASVNEPQSKLSEFKRSVEKSDHIISMTDSYTVRDPGNIYGDTQIFKVFGPIQNGVALVLEKRLIPVGRMGNDLTHTWIFNIQKEQVNFSQNDLLKFKEQYGDGFNALIEISDTSEFKEFLSFGFEGFATGMFEQRDEAYVFDGLLHVGFRRYAPRSQLVIFKAKSENGQWKYELVNKRNGNLEKQLQEEGRREYEDGHIGL